MSLEDLNNTIINYWNSKYIDNYGIYSYKNLDINAIFCETFFIAPGDFTSNQVIAYKNKNGDIFYRKSIDERPITLLSEKDMLRYINITVFE